MDIDEEEEQMEQKFEEEIKKMNTTIVSENEITKDCTIGEGGFGKVYKGKYKNNLVAIKKIKLIEKTPEIFTDLVNEIKAIQTADIPGVPKFYGIFKKKGNYHLLFEFVCGKTLKEIYPLMNYDQKLITLYKLSALLESLHSKLLIHRDIKPSNVMIKEDSSVILIDFGVSKIARHTKTYTMLQKGTVSYMQPEQFQIDLNKYENPDIDDVKPVPISTKSDIWSLGVMTSEIFSGVQPYFNISGGHRPNDQLIIKRLLNKMPFPIPENLDNDIKNIVQRTTEVDVEKRATATETKELFQKIIEKNKINFENVKLI